MPQGFPPARRVRRRGEFKRAFDGGRRIHGRLLTLVAVPSSGPDSRLGIVASRKIGNAVARNRAKRLIRQAFRTTEPPNSAFDLVVILKPGTPVADISSLTAEYKLALRRLQKSKL